MHASQNNPARPEALAQRIEPTSTWADIALPEPQLRILRELAAHAAQLVPAYEDRHPEINTSPARGILALFTGPSGTGKTMAAEVLARDLRLQLYRVDLAQVVSKYIGETEKNLSLIFSQASPGGAILFFDEADALFGRRSELTDNHDRYANTEVNYLLQRAQEHCGLVILGTHAPVEWPPPPPPRACFVVDFSAPA